ncbi:MAG: hypothetical protein RBT73_11980, partial [Spirochaetia bacterium]|nr:hypothetical protein [Spirochaetia bacterium]
FPISHIVLQGAGLHKTRGDVDNVRHKVLDDPEAKISLGELPSEASSRSLWQAGACHPRPSPQNRPPTFNHKYRQSPYLLHSHPIGRFIECPDCTGWYL